MRETSDFRVRIMRPFAVVAVLMFATGVMGCEDASSANGRPVAPPVPLKTGDGVVRGVVKLDGVPPTMASIANQPCQSTAVTPRLASNARMSSSRALPLVRCSRPAAKSSIRWVTVCCAQVRLVPMRPRGPRLIHPVT